MKLILGARYKKNSNGLLNSDLDKIPDEVILTNWNIGFACLYESVEKLNENAHLNQIHVAYVTFSHCFEFVNSPEYKQLRIVKLGTNYYYERSIKPDGMGLGTFCLLEGEIS